MSVRSHCLGWSHLGSCTTRCTTPLMWVQGRSHSTRLGQDQEEGSTMRACEPCSMRCAAFLRLWLCHPVPCERQHHATAPGAGCRQKSSWGWLQTEKLLWLAAGCTQRSSATHPQQAPAPQPPPLPPQARPSCQTAHGAGQQRTPAAAWRPASGSQSMPRCLPLLQPGSRPWSAPRRCLRLWRSSGSRHMVRHA